MTLPSNNNVKILIGTFAIIILLFIISAVGRPLIFGLTGLKSVNDIFIFLSSCTHWLCLLLLWIYVTKVEKQPFLLWKEREYGFLYYIVHIIAIFFFIFLLAIPIMMIFQLLHLVKVSPKINELREIVKNNEPLLAFICLTAGIVEEAIFRGYILPRFEVLFKNAYYAIIISSLFFGLLHFKYGTLINMVGPFIIGLVLAYHYWRFRNIKMVMLAHFLWDFMSLTLSVKFNHLH